MDRNISISTPESLEFSHEPAGIGSRFVASVIDAILQAAMMLGVLSSAGVWTLPLKAATCSSTMWAGAVTMLLAFLVLWGYHIFFEMIWNGQTPGKRTVGIRILKDGGYPIGFLDSVVRNLLRLVDFLPFSSGVGLVVMLCNSRFKRVGDFAAGTIVVKERRIKMPHSLTSDPVELREDIIFGGQPLTNVYELSDAEFDVVRQFMVRRHELQKDARLALSIKIARPLARKLGLRPELILGKDEEFLERLARAYGQ